MKIFVRQIITLLSLILCCVNTLNAQQKNIEAIILDNSCWRVGSYEIKLTEDSIFVTKENLYETSKSYSFVMDSKDWKRIKSTVQDIDLKIIDTFSSPTNQRAVDVACYDRITIMTKDNKEYRTQYFDGGRPMAIISTLYSQICKIYAELVSQKLID